MKNAHLSFLPGKHVHANLDWLKENYPYLHEKVLNKAITEEQAYTEAQLVFPRFSITTYVERRKAVELLHDFYDKVEKMMG